MRAFILFRNFALESHDAYLQCFHGDKLRGVNTTFLRKLRNGRQIDLLQEQIVRLILPLLNTFKQKKMMDQTRKIESCDRNNSSSLRKSTNLKCVHEIVRETSLGNSQPQRRLPSLEPQSGAPAIPCLLSLVPTAGSFALPRSNSSS